VWNASLNIYLLRQISWMLSYAVENSYVTCSHMPRLAVKNEYWRNKSQHWYSSLHQYKAIYSRMLPGFPEAPLKKKHITHVPFTPLVRIKASHTEHLGVG